MTFCISTLCITTPCITTFCSTAFLMTFFIKTLSMLAFCLTTLNITIKNATLSIYLTHCQVSLSWVSSNWVSWRRPNAHSLRCFSTKRQGAFFCSQFINFQQSVGLICSELLKPFFSWNNCCCCCPGILFLSFLRGILKGEVSLYHWPPVWLVWSQLYDTWQFLFLFAKQTNPNQSNRRSMVQWYFPP
jgi:hypothetical protein